MTKQALNKYIGKRVEVTFTDGDVLHGTLGQGMGLGNRLYNDDKSYYNLPENNLTFRAYHVKKIKELEK
jgi:gluconate kinase